jgi:hypothetical protein
MPIIRSTRVNIRGQISLVFPTPDVQLIIDFLVVSKSLWIAVLESKGTEVNLDMAIPQTLAYMMANPDTEKPVFGMATNGGEFFFLKLNRPGTPQYDISRIFSHLPLQNEFYDVLRILKRLGKNIEELEIT